MFKTTFIPTGCRIKAETSHYNEIGEDAPSEFDQITIKLYSSEDVYIGQIVAMRIPSSMSPNNAEIFHPWYSMAIAMADFNKEMKLIANEMNLGMHFMCNLCRTGLDHNDLYQIISVFVTPEFRRKGVGTWMFSNMQNIIRDVTREREPVCVLVPPRVEVGTKVLHETDEWLMELYQRTGWTPVKEDARTLYFNPYH